MVHLLFVDKRRNYPVKNSGCSEFLKQGPAALSSSVYGRRFCFCRKYTAYFRIAQVYQQFCCIVYFWHDCYHTVAFLFIEHHPFASLRKYQGATEMMKQHIWLNAHISLTDRWLIE